MKIELLELRSNVDPVVEARFNAVYVFYKRGIEAMQLIPRSGAELENLAMGGADERGDAGGVFVGDKAVGCARDLLLRRWAWG